MNNTGVEEIQIDVKTKFSAEHSDPDNAYYFFIYQITITNNGNYSVQLISRRWEITNEFGEKRFVEGVGVVGEQPVLRPGDSFSYQSGCNFATETGKMRGAYLMERLDGSGSFFAEIPEFGMVVTALLN